MGRWTDWMKLAEGGDHWGDELGEYNECSCYELGLKSPSGRDIISVYVGHTKNEANRMWDYAYRGAHLSKLIDKLLA